MTSRTLSSASGGFRGQRPRTLARHTTCAVIRCRRGLRPTCLTRNELSGTQPSRTLRSNIRNIRRTSEGTLLAYLWLWTAGLRKDSRKTATCCSSFAEPCPRSEGFVSRKGLELCTGAELEELARAQPGTTKKQAHSTNMLQDQVPQVGASQLVAGRGHPDTAEIERPRCAEHHQGRCGGARFFPGTEVTRNGCEHIKRDDR